MTDAGPAAAPAPLFTIRGSIAPTQLTISYRAGLVVVAAAMLLLPVVYIALIALIGAGVWWHLTADTSILQSSGGAQGRLLLYLAPAIAGIVVLFFMVKPLLARSTARRD